jgi:two-component system response regulator GlrR
VAKSQASDQILLVDDDEQLSDIMCLCLESEGFTIRACTDPSTALGLVSREDFMAILLDIRLGEHDGVDLLRKIREMDSEIPIFMITAHGELDSAVKSFTLGANGYIRKPFQEGELRSQVVHAVEDYRLKRELRALKASASADDVRAIFHTRDPGLEPLLKRIALAAGVTSSVVITGETGTGKEVVARTLHQIGPRAKGPFVAFNCAAVPENLIESELFGYMRGAFTDARDNKPGLFVRANGGTLFLDEIGDAPLSVQAKLLRVLQEKEVLPLGGTHPIPVNVRIVAATHRDLESAVSQGLFRQDLFYRLHVIPLKIPALRERPKDVLFLASIFARKLCEEMGIQFQGLSHSAQEALLTHHWPGNVRELQNRIERAVVLGHASVLKTADLFPERPGVVEEIAESFTAEPCPPFDEALPSYGDAKNSFERNYLERVLSVAKGNIAKAARLASKSRTEVYGLIRKHGIDPTKFKLG